MVSGRAAGLRSRRRAPTAGQAALFEVQVRPELRFYRQIMDALDRTGFGADPLDAELVVAKVLGTVWDGQARRDGELEEAFGLGLVDYARHRHRPVTVALLRTVAVIATIREVRAAARDAANALVASGLPEPRWRPPIGAPRPGRCWAFEDVFGDQSTVVCEFAYPVPSAGPRARAMVLDGLPSALSGAGGVVPGGHWAAGATGSADTGARDLDPGPGLRGAGIQRDDAGTHDQGTGTHNQGTGTHDQAAGNDQAAGTHDHGPGGLTHGVPHAIVVAVDHSRFGVATDAMLTMEVDHLIRDMTNDAKQSRSMLTLRRVDPAWARALLGRAFARTDLIDGIVVEPTFAELRAIAMARLDLLPEDSLALPPAGPQPSPDELVAQFLTSGALAGAPLAGGDQAAVERAAQCVAEYTVRYDPTQVLRVGPAKWEVFVDDWLPGWSAGAAERAAVPAVVRAWSAWAAALTNLPDLARAELGAVLDELFPD